MYGKIELPEIVLKRIVLRPISLDDTHDLYEINKLPNVGPSAGWRPHKSIDETINWISYSIKKKDFGQPGVFCIHDKHTNKAIGNIEIHTYAGYKAEVGYVLSPAYWGHGIMVEAGIAVIEYAFEVLHLERLSCSHFIDNIRSRRVIEKLGFKFEGIARNKFKRFDGVTVDEAIYAITREDYHNRILPWQL